MTTLQGSIHLNRAVLTEVTEDPNVLPLSVVAGTAGSASGGSGKVDQTSQSGSVRQYGSGRSRVILGSAVTRTQTFALMAITQSDVDTLRSLLGHKVCYRDHYGRKVFGAFLDMADSNIPFSGGLHNVGIVIQSATHDEAV